jgi:cytochrome c-type biogenesis protein
MSVTFTAMGTLISVLGSSFASFAEYLRWFSIIFIIGMGAVLFDEDIANTYATLTSRIISRTKLNRQYANPDNTSMIGGFTLGLSLGILWIPCVGPILGAVLAYVAVEAAGTGSILYGAFQLFVYSVGVGIPMLAIAYSGKTISGRTSRLVRYAPLFKKISGAVLIAVGIMILFGVDKFIQAYMIQNYNWTAII